MSPKRPEKKSAKKQGKSPAGANAPENTTDRPGGRRTAQRSKKKKGRARSKPGLASGFGSIVSGLAQGAVILGVIVLSLWLARDWLTGGGSKEPEKTVAGGSALSVKTKPPLADVAAGSPTASSPAATRSPTASSPVVNSPTPDSPAASAQALEGVSAATNGRAAPDPVFDGNNAQAKVDRESNLPFKENERGLTEWIRRVDYALAQTSLRLGLGKEELELTGFEKRLVGNSSYTFQRLSLSLPVDSAPFVLALEQNLKVIAPGAVLAREGAGHWRILINGLLTHDITIERKDALNDALNEFEEGGDTPPTVRATLDELMAQEPGNHKGRLAIVIDDMGANLESMRLLVGLNYPVSVAVWPYGGKARESAELAHAHGLTVLVHMPMEPVRYPRFKPGPDALYTDMSLQQVHDILRENLDKVPHAVGVNNHMGSRFTQWRQGAEEVVRAASERSFFILDSVTHPDSVLFSEAVRLGVPAYKRHVFLDNKGSLNSILEQLRLAERVALHQGEAIAIGHPLPATLEALKLWQKRRDQRVELVLVQRLTPNRP